MAFGQTTDVRSCSWGVAPGYGEYGLRPKFEAENRPKMRNFKGRRAGSRHASERRLTAADALIRLLLGFSSNRGPLPKSSQIR
jgi:hypothetical protein